MCNGARLTVVLLLLAGCRQAADTPLKQAAEAGDAPAVRDLLARGIPADEPGHPGLTALVLAARQGHLEVMSALLVDGAEVNGRDRVATGWPPLVHAIHKGQNGAVRLLLENGAAPDIRLDGGATPLMFAAACGNTEVVRELLERGADPRAETKGGVSALSNALGGGAFFDFTDGPSIGTCHTETARALLARAPDLTLPRGGWSRLARAFARSDACREAIQRIARR
jgi:uncharacterized protein